MASTVDSPLDRELDALYAAVPPMRNCKGLCHHSCSSVMMAEVERDRIRARHGVTVPDGAFELERPGGRCPALNIFGRCTVYEDRPLVCRLWGTIPDMECPHGCEPVGGMLSAETGERVTLRLFAIQQRADRRRGRR